MPSTKEIVLLATSSPHQYTIDSDLTLPTSHVPFVPDSDDSLPSASKFFRRPVDARLKSGTRATHVPRDAIVGIQSVSALVKQNMLNVDQEKHQEELEKTHGKDAKKPRKPRVKGKTGAAKKSSAKEKKDSAGKPKHQRKRKSEGNDIFVREKEAIGTRESITGGTEYKNREGKKASKASRPKQNKTSATSAHFAVDDGGKANPIENVTVVQQAATISDIRIATAIKRRTDWTPPKDRHPEKVLNPDRPIFDVLPAPKAASSTKKLDFANLQKTFAYTPDPESTSANPIRKESLSSAPNKRRRIEMIDQPTAQALKPTIEGPALIELKKKSPKKSYKSITARTVDKYSDPKPIETTVEKAFSHVAPIFKVPPEVSISPKVSSKDELHKPNPRKPRNKGNGADKKETTRPKKGGASKVKAISFCEQKLLSPTEHGNRLGRQDFLFGTASQLITNDSPTYVREMQQAIRESEAVTLVVQERKDSSPLQLRVTGAIRRTGGKLWAEGARHTEDGEHQTPASASNAEAAFETAAMGTEIAEQPRTRCEPPMEDVCCTADNAWHDIDEISSSPAPLSSTGFFMPRSTSVTPPLTFQAPLAATLTTISTSGQVNTTHRTALRPLSTNAKSPKRVASSTTDVITMSEEALTPVKQRGRPRKETEAREDQQAGPKRSWGRPPKDTGTNLGIAPNRPRTRPTKAKSNEASNNTKTLPLQATPTKATAQKENEEDGFQDIDEIEDSECDIAPTPPRKRKGEPPGTPPLPKLMTTEAVSKRVNTVVATANHPRWPEIQAKLFPEITAAIKKAPRTFNPKKPSWHEKMLMYDPIVIEDLTEWLNEQGLRFAGKNDKDEELLCWMVQAWCENNSVCCLWREGLWGGVRTRY